MDSIERVFCRQCGLKILRDDTRRHQTAYYNGFCSYECQEVYDAIRDREQGL